MQDFRRRDAIKRTAAILTLLMAYLVVAGAAIGFVSLGTSQVITRFAAEAPR